MADSMMTSETNTIDLKEALQAQQQLLQRLYTELDAEREASASAASEALSVILRLQGEKAAIKLESEHYKRLAEENMCHAEESLDIIEDIIYDKEMEVATLNYQIESCHHKLLSMGCEDSGIDEIEYPTNIFERTEADKLAEIESNVDEEENDEEIKERIPESLDRRTDNSNSGNIDYYWEHIKKFDERVQEIAAHSPRSVLSTRSPRSVLSKKIRVMNGIHHMKTSSSTSIDTADVDSPCSVYDVFEVPEVDQKFESHESPKGKRDEKFETNNVVHHEAVKDAKVNTHMDFVFCGHFGLW